MDAAELRAMQAPIKEAYKTAPEKAVVTLKATGELGADKIATGITNRKSVVPGFG